MSQEPRWETCAACFGQKVSWDAALTARFSMKAEMSGTNVPCRRVWVLHESPELSGVSQLFWLGSKQGSWSVLQSSPALILKLGCKLLIFGE